MTHVTRVSPTPRLVYWQAPPGEVIMSGFPAGNVIYLGRRVGVVHYIRYVSPDGTWREMDTHAYLHIADRIVLAQDRWPRTMPGREVRIDVTVAD